MTKYLEEFERAETEYFRRRATKEKKLESRPKTIEIVCPHCKKINRMPENAGVNVICSYCGGQWYSSGIEVFDKETLAFYNKLNKENKQETEKKSKD